MTELEYIITRFEEKFSAFKGRRIVIHGSRSYAEAIIANFNEEYHFVGVMSRDPIAGESFCGLQVLQEESIPDLDIDMIILTERVKYAEAVYTAIYRGLQERGIELYNMYGLDEIALHKELSQCRVQQLEGWKTICAPYELVVFETMDTLFAPPYFQKDLVARPMFRKLIAWLTDQNIDVDFSLRKSYSEDIQAEALKKQALCPGIEDRIIRRRGEDLSFRQLREKNPDKRILYIGAGLVNECLLPRCYDIDTYRFIVSEFDCLAPVGDENAAQRPFDANQRERIEQKILKSRLVSFDIFDTLLLRKTLLPSDVFELTELRAKQAGLPAEGFAAKRRLAEQNGVFPNIYDIYAELQNIYGWDEAMADRMLALELGTERAVIVPRKEIADLLLFATQAGKPVVLTSDMYLPEAILRELLESNGIRGFSHIFVSCDRKQSKESGLFESLLSIEGDRGAILHMGDNPRADGLACKKYGIESVIIPSPLAFAMERGWEASIRTADSLMERSLVGMTISSLFRNPFQNPNLRELPADERLHRYADGVIAPLTAGHMTWLLSKLKKEKFDGVLFLARDGWLPMRIYQKLNVHCRLPKPIYYYANRHSAFLCCADFEKSVDYIAAMSADNGHSNIETLKSIYSLGDSQIRPTDENESIGDCIRRHMPEISEAAEAARKGYLRYSEENGMHRGGTYAVIDCFASGTTQAFLQSFLPFKMQGYYFGNYKVDSINNCDISYYLQGEKDTLLKNFIELEAFLCSPEPSLDHLSEGGAPVFAEEVRSAEVLREVQTVLDAALKYALAFFELFYCEGEVIRPRLVEEMFAADGYHWVQRSAFDDWMKTTIKTRRWQGENGREQ